MSLTFGRRSCAPCLPAGGDARVPFPTCGVHHMHLACLAQFRAQASGLPSELFCPLCSPDGWTAREDVALREMCQRRGVPIPNRISGESTYAIRTFTSHDAPEPRAPPDVRLLGCQVVAANGRAPGRAPATAWKRSAGCWPNCPRSRTCSVPGCCSFSAPLPELSICRVFFFFFFAADFYACMKGFGPVRTTLQGHQS